MKKAAVISAMVLAAALSFQGTWAREPVAGEAASVSRQPIPMIIKSAGSPW